MVLESDLDETSSPPTLSVEPFRPRRIVSTSRGRSRRVSARRKTRIKAVDIKRNLGRAVAEIARVLAITAGMWNVSISSA